MLLTLSPRPEAQSCASLPSRADPSGGMHHFWMCIAAFGQWWYTLTLWGGLRGVVLGPTAATAACREAMGSPHVPPPAQQKEQPHWSHEVRQNVQCRRGLEQVVLPNLLSFHATVTDRPETSRFIILAIQMIADNILGQFETVHGRH